METTQIDNPEPQPQEGEFRFLKGIGVEIETMLHDNGIQTFEQLAKLTPEEIAKALPGIAGVKKRAANQDWAGQAASFARQLAVGSNPVEGKEEGGRQHYASFMVELLLDEDQNVRRTTLTNIQKKEPVNWAGWDPQRTVNWIAQQAGILSETAAPSPEPSTQKPASRDMTKKPGLAGAPLFEPIRLIPSVKHLRSTIFAGEPFSAALEMDLSQVAAPAGMSLHYQAAAQIRPIGRANAPVITQSDDGEVFPSAKVRLVFPFQGLAAGPYYLDAAVLLSPANPEMGEQNTLSAMTEGLLIHVQAEQSLLLKK